MLTIAAAFVIGVFIGWTTPEPAWAKAIQAKLFGPKTPADPAPPATPAA